jgi:hypothetical protein
VNLWKPLVGRFEKRTLLELAWNTSKGVFAWLMNITGMDVGHDKTLVAIVDGLIVASVDIGLIRKWVGAEDAEGAYDWCPNVQKFLRDSSDWEESKDDRSKDM